jgi:hypothetical protein
MYELKSLTKSFKTVREKNIIINTDLMQSIPMFRYFMWCRNVQFDECGVIKRLIRLDIGPNQLRQVLVVIRYIFEK